MPPHRFPTRPPALVGAACAGPDLAEIGRRLARASGVRPECRGRPQLPFASAEEISTR